MTDRKGYPRGQHSRAPRSRDPHIDEIAVQKACNGESVLLTVAERGEAIRRLTALGLNSRAIAERLRIADRTVFRHRSGEVYHGRTGFPHSVDCGCGSLWIEDPQFMATLDGGTVVA